MALPRYPCLLLLLCTLVGCKPEQLPWNAPHSATLVEGKTLFMTLGAPLKHLDPARVYEMQEATVIGQIYEPPFGYDYWKRPYTLIPLLASKPLEVIYKGAGGQVLSHPHPNEIAVSEYHIYLQKNVHYAPHPAFAKDAQGQPWYRTHPEELTDIDSPLSLSHQDTRECVAEDFVYQIKRLADPEVDAPIYAFMSQWIVGLKELRETLSKAYAEKQSINLTQMSLKGVYAVDPYHYVIQVKGHYPQFQHWLTMLFFAPMPFEAVDFYAMPALQKKNINLERYPVGTGAFKMQTYNPRLRIILDKNPMFRKVLERTVQGGTLQPLPLLDTLVFTFEKEYIPAWLKFLQGYYDSAGVNTDTFAQAFTPVGQDLTFSESMKAKGVKLERYTMPNIFYWSFNFSDPIVGGNTPSARKLREAISIAFDVEEYVQIFHNGYAQVAQGPIPPGIAGYDPKYYNPNVYEAKQRGVHRKDLSRAQALMQEAGYPGGIDLKTHKPLTLYFDTITAGGPNERSEQAWVREQFKKIGIELIVRAYLYPHFQDKIRQGDTQFFSWGWNADYPDPENFLFLFYGPESVTHHGGMNYSNYVNPEFDKCFVTVKHLPDGPEKTKMTQGCVDILQKDTPWIWGFFPENLSLNHQWRNAGNQNAFSRNILWYRDVNAVQRLEKIKAWNQPTVKPLLYTILGVILFLVPAIWQLWRQSHRPYRQPKGKNG